MFTMRFDMRAPTTGAPAPELYAAALEMAAYAETRGCLAGVACEHHLSEDGYLPDPLTLATALAARTTSLPIMVAVLVLPLYDPVRLAERMAVIDNLSRGRVSYVAAIGYRPEEYELYGVDFHRRGVIAEEKLNQLFAALERVTPRPFSPAGPGISWGGGSPAAARRAGRLGLGFFAQGGGAELQQVYEEAAREAGREPGFCYVPPVDSASTVFVAEDVDKAWEELGPYLLHDVLTYAAWNEGNTHTANLSFVETVEELRAENRSHRILTVEEAVAMIRAGSPLNLHPLVGGLPPETAWHYLKIVTDRVMEEI